LFRLFAVRQFGRGRTFAVYAATFAIGVCPPSPLSYQSFSAISLTRAVDKFSDIFASVATYLPQAGERSLRGAGAGVLVAARHGR